MSKAPNTPCPYCGAPTKCVDSKEVYRRSYGWLWMCSRYPECDAYVGCHKGTKKPLGRLANLELRAAKIAAHEAFDRLWKMPDGTRIADRSYAYKVLAANMNLPLKECHIGMFDVEQCHKVVEISLIARGAVQ